MPSAPGPAAQSSCSRPAWLYSYDSRVWPGAVMHTEATEPKLFIHAMQEIFIKKLQ